MERLWISLPFSKRSSRVVETCKSNRRGNTLVIVMKEMATETMISAVAERLERNGFQVHKVVGVNRTILGAIGDKRTVDIREFEILGGAREVIRITEPYKLS